MQHSVKSLIGFTMGATDGEIGKVDEFYFDDETWTIRYLVVKTGGWLMERKVLISPGALRNPDWKSRSFPVDLTKKQVKHSPDIDTAKPVSRQQELALYDHYEWPYGDPTSGGFYGQMGVAGMIDSRVPFEASIAATDLKRQPGDPHLRSVSEVIGYHIHATNGEIGHVADLMVDEHFKVSFMIVETGSWFSERKILLSPQRIKEINWANSSVEVDVSMETVKDM
ncbi:hypothetical protein CPT03_07330 [Pedobacter ginsengisoli]|uniref:PRC-barrel domain-containing protein n=1 Tax=Pedobacter ginsengisoli TaxID=363852 RepID=A0A2D1U3X7_9SPHI|nr:PRC-barrel domain-containing protein [Pedobacter ginsengisoli]ATP56296.1 hypothetical protein CPT03_07330 [Pedobacter ginsengisoli]